MKILTIIISIVLFTSCSIFQSSSDEETTTKKTPEEVYVFDDVADTNNNKDAEIDDLKKQVDDSMEKGKNQQDQNMNSNQNVTQNYNQTNNEYQTPTSNSNMFYLQLGAFSSLSRAEQFISENESKVPFKMSVVFNNQKGLYTVRSTAYKTKSEAQMIKEGFWQQNMFKDAFIVTE